MAPSPNRATVCAEPTLTSAVPATAAAAPSAPAPPTNEPALSLLALIARLPASSFPPVTSARAPVLNVLTTPVAAPPANPAPRPVTMASALWLVLLCTTTSPAAFTVARSMEALLCPSNTLDASAPVPDTPAPAATPAT